MKKKNVFLIIGLVMLIVMVVYVGFAISHPTYTSPFPLKITLAFYWVYLITTIIFLITSIILFIKDKVKNKTQ